MKIVLKNFIYDNTIVKKKELIDIPDDFLCREDAEMVGLIIKGAAERAADEVNHPIRVEEKPLPRFL